MLLLTCVIPPVSRRWKLRDHPKIPQLDCLLLASNLFGNRFWWMAKLKSVKVYIVYFIQRNPGVPSP